MRVGCREEMKEHLPAIVQGVVPLLTDPVPRVRHGACRAIGQMSTDFAAVNAEEAEVSFDAQFHSSVIPALMACIRCSEGHPRVQVRVMSLT